jgi:hypothetical protein
MVLSRAVLVCFNRRLRYDTRYFFLAMTTIEITPQAVVLSPALWARIGSSAENQLLVRGADVYVVAWNGYGYYLPTTRDRRNRAHADQVVMRMSCRELVQRVRVGVWPASVSTLFGISALRIHGAGTAQEEEGWVILPTRKVRLRTRRPVK